MTSKIDLPKSTPPAAKTVHYHDCDACHNDTPQAPPLDILVTFAGEIHTFHLPADAVLDDLTIACEDHWSGNDGDSDAATTEATYNWSAHKFIGPPPVGLLKGAEHHDRPLGPLFARAKKPVTLRLVAPRASAVESLRAVEASVRRREARWKDQRRRAVRARPTARSSSAQTPYTFQELRPLAHLPQADRSLAYLQRLRDDVGVRAAMQAHHFTVGLLTEMDPRAHTTATHEGTTRTLGLNRNQGAVIELRLRTDADDGYRDYRTVRRTLCHELAHNVHGPHDGQFWALCHQLEREVERADYYSSGRTLAGDVDDSFRRPTLHDADAGLDDDDHTDAGGWTGGSFVLGNGTSSSAPVTPVTPVTARRDLAARAAEDRLRRMAEQRRHGDGGNGSSSQH